jgi:hypothetical protein
LQAMASSATHERRRLKVKYPQRVNGDHSEPERVSLILILFAHCYIFNMELQQMCKRYTLSTKLAK